MNILYLDCFLGFDAEMLLGALVNLAGDIKVTENELKNIFPSANITSHEETRCSIEALRVDVTSCAANNKINENDAYGFIDSLKADSAILSALKRTAKAFFTSLNRSPITDKTIDESELVTELARVCALCLTLKQINADYVISSHLREGRTINQCSSTPMPVPSPITMEILKSAKIPVRGIELETELIPPWGAAALSCFANEYGPMPDMDIIKIGYGAGKDDLSMPNIIRAVLGSSRSAGLDEMFESSDLFSEFSDELTALV